MKPDHRYTFLALLIGLAVVVAEEIGRDRAQKLLPVFQIVRFPNDPCEVSSGTKNGTCYTAEECSSRSGVNSGSCAEGFGVCCTFSLSCGGSSSENCTYFESANTVAEGGCSAQICRCNSNVCQIRLDFNNFIITGPSTDSASVGKLLNGELATGAGKEVTDATQCLTDTFTVTGQSTLPYICGINNGQHVYFDASDTCNDLVFQLGNRAIGVGTVATRSWSIKATQISCDDENRAPAGCDQWYFGSGATNAAETFNYQSGNGKHLANQHQTICVRREAGNCRICWYAAALTDFQLSGKTDPGQGNVKASNCCGYGTDGMKIAEATGGYDCVMIPGAEKTTAIGNPAPASLCGANGGLVTASGLTSKTVCSTQQPFQITFNSDDYEHSAAAKDEGTGGNKGFRLVYFQDSTNC